MNYVENWRYETPNPDLPGFRLMDPKVTPVAELSAKVVALRARVDRAEATANFLAAALESTEAENRELRAGVLVDAMRGYLVMTREAVDKAPPTVADWLKAFGGYSGASPAPSPVSEPAKPVDPRSEALGRAMDFANRSPDGYAR